MRFDYSDQSVEPSARKSFFTEEVFPNAIEGLGLFEIFRELLCIARGDKVRTHYGPL